MDTRWPVVQQESKSRRDKGPVRTPNMCQDSVARRSSHARVFWVWTTKAEEAVVAVGEDDSN